MTDTNIVVDSHSQSRKQRYDIGIPIELDVNETTGMKCRDDDDDHKIDVSKSLYYLRLYGFDIHTADTTTTMSMASIATTPTRNVHCVTPTASPMQNSYRYQKRGISTLKQTSQHPSVSPKATSHTSICTPELPFSKSESTVEILFDDVLKDRLLSQEGARITRPSHQISPPLEDKETTSFHVPVVNRCHYQPKILSTTISDDSDAVEVIMLESSSVSFDDDDEEDDDDSYEEQNNPSIIPTHKNNIGDFTTDGLSVLDIDDDAFEQSISMTPQTPARVSFCGIPNWCDTSISQKNIFFDDNSTPTRTVQLRHRSSADPWLCSAVWCSNINGTDVVGLTSTQNVLQNHICTALGDSIDSFCWQQSTSTLFQHQMSTCMTTPTGHPSSFHPQSSPMVSSTTVEGKSPILTKHRRLSTLPAYRRTSKFLSLRYNLHPFNDTITPIAQHNIKQPFTMHKSQSFQHNKQNRPTIKDDKAMYPTEWECGALDFALAYEDDEGGNIHTRPIGKDRIVNNDDEYDGYESDPEIFCKNDVPKHSFPRTQRLETSGTLQEFLNERCTFIWHSTTFKSIAVYAWIERGHQLYDSLVLPKLCWKPILSQQSTLDTSNIGNLHRSSSIGGDFFSVELLDICRILPVCTHDRQRHPFAVPQRLLNIQITGNNTNTSECNTAHEVHNLIFEARSLSDRIRYMNLLKLAISTLAAKFLTNDPNAFTLFFHNPSISGPVE